MITVEHLTKRYGDFLAVDDLSFEIDEGHVYGFLGPNGAGKSTLMKILAGAVPLDSGTIRVADETGELKRVNIKDPVTAQRLGV